MPNTVPVAVLVVAVTTGVLTGVVVGGVGGSPIATDPAPQDPGWSGPGIDIPWNVTIDIGERTGMIVQASTTTDDGYLLVGTRQVGGNYPGPVQAWAWEVTPNGSVTWATQLAGNHTKAIDVIPTEEGYAVLGFNFPESSIVFGGNTWIQPITPSGDRGDRTTIERQSLQLPNALAQTADGSFLIAGATGGRVVPDTHQWSEWTWYPFGSDGWLAKTDGSGTVDWTRRYNDSTGLRDVIAVDGGAVAVGWATNHTTGIPFTTPVVTRVTADGSVQMNRSIETPNGGRFSTIDHVGDRFVVGGSGYVVPPDANTSKPTGDIVEPALTVYGLDATLSPVWNRTLPDHSPALVRTSTVLANGTVAVGGMVEYPGGGVTIATATPTGTVTGAAIVGDDWGDIPAGVSPTANATVAVTGFSEVGFSSVENGWVFGARLTGQPPSAIPLDAVEPPPPPTSTTTTTTTAATSSTTTDGTTTGDTGPGFSVTTLCVALGILGAAAGIRHRS